MAVLTDDELEQLLISIYLGRVDKFNLPQNLYGGIVDELTEALLEGFGDIENAKETTLFESLYQNIQMFSGAKTYQQIAEFQDYIVIDGQVTEYPEFRKMVLSKYETYNKTWLEIEYLYTVENARAAKHWVGIWENRKLFGLLEYVTVGDDRVRPEHRLLDGTVRPVEDSFWNNYYPPIGYRCRCTTKSYEDGEMELTEIKNSKKEIEPPKIDRQFRFNSGKKGIIFSKWHPYFTEIPKDIIPWAQYNFGLLIEKYGE